MNQQYVIGIDIGGTSAAAGLVDAEGNLMAQRQFVTADYPEAGRFVHAVRKSIDAMVAEIPHPVRLCGIGVGAPNGNYYTGRIEYAPNMPWKGVVDLAGMMEAAIGLPVVLTNDANAAALGEKLFGGAKGMDDFVVITIGTGLGSGIVSNGGLVYGHSGFAGELGHTNAVRDGRPCSCGRLGCLETYVSARGLHQTYVDLLSDPENPIDYHTRDLGTISARDIYQAARDGDPLAQKAFAHTGRILGRELADLVAISSPEVIFLYGGLSASGDLLLQPTRKAMDENMLPVFRGRVRVELSHLEGKSAAILGAAALAWDVLCEEEHAEEPA